MQFEAVGRSDLELLHKGAQTGLKRATHACLAEIICMHRGAGWQCTDAPQQHPTRVVSVHVHGPDAKPSDSLMNALSEGGPPCKRSLLTVLSP